METKQIGLKVEELLVVVVDPLSPPDTSHQDWNTQLWLLEASIFSLCSLLSGAPVVCWSSCLQRESTAVAPLQPLCCGLQDWASRAEPSLLSVARGGEAAAAVGGGMLLFH